MVKRADMATLLITDLQLVPFDPGAWQRFAVRLSEHLRGKAALGTAHLPTLQPMNLTYTFISDTAKQAYRDYYFAISPWQAWMRSAGRGTVAAGGSVNPLPPETYRRTEFYADFLRPLELHHGITARVLQGPSSATDFLIMRPESAGPMDSDELRLMRGLTPYIRNALTVKRLLDAAGGMAVPARPEMGVLLVDRSGRVLYANDSAYLMLASGEGLTTTHRRGLRAVHPAAQAQLMRLLRRAIDGGGDLSLRRGGDMLLPRPGNAALRLTIAATPPASDAFGEVEPAALLLLRERPAPLLFSQLCASRGDVL